jgi:hypothetical protein
MKSLRHVLSTLSIYFIITVIFGTIYVTTQQALRAGANDPQIQIAEDTAIKLKSGVTPASLLKEKIQINESLSPFLQIYDSHQKLVAGNGYLHNIQPIIPDGVTTATRYKSYNAVTWQPAPDIRIASVSVQADGFYVVSGRNMKEVEQRETHTLALTTFGWLMAMLGLTVGVVIRK